MYDVTVLLLMPREPKFEVWSLSCLAGLERMLIMLISSFSGPPVLRELSVSRAPLEAKVYALTVF